MKITIFLNYTETGDKKSQFRNNSQFHESRENMILFYFKDKTRYSLLKFKKKFFYLLEY